MAKFYVRPDYPGTQSESYIAYISIDTRLSDITIFNSSHITIQNGSFSNFRFVDRTNQLTTYAIDVMPPTGTGETSIIIAANVYQNNETVTEKIPYAATVLDTIKIKTAPSGTRSGPFTVYLIFFPSAASLRRLLNESVAAFQTYISSFSESSISITNGTLSNYGGLDLPPGSEYANISVKFDINPSSGNGNCTISIPANSWGNNAVTSLVVPYTDVTRNINIIATDIHCYICIWLSLIHI